MSNPTWPTSLPTPLVTNITYAPLVDPILATQMEGAMKTRRRFTALPEKLTCSVMLTEAQLATFQTFVKTTLAYTLPFDWIDFRVGTAATYVFLKTPTEQYVASAERLWRVDLELMKEP